MIETDHPTRRFIRDTQGRQYELTSLLGRGSHGKVYRADDTDTGLTLAAKFPLNDEDFSGAAVEPGMKALYSRLLRDEAAQLRKLPPNRIPALYGIVDGGGAVPCLLMEHFQDSLLERLRQGMNFAQLCDALARTCRALEVIHATRQTHGNLKPGNIFFVKSKDGTTQVRFTDPLTPFYLKSLDALSVRDSTVGGWLPPECLSADTQLPLPQDADTFALGKLMFEAVVHPEHLTASFSGKGGPFVGAIDKGKLNQFRTALAQRLQEGKSNPHVRELLIKRATSFLARVLSKESEPSPPYRFRAVTEMANRLDELRGLFHPGFQQLGSLISGSQHADGGFHAGEEIRFSLSFRCHGGIDDAGLITCMTYVRDLVAEQKVREAGVEVSPSHDGHRFRFSFRIPHLDPGYYLVRVALAIKGSPGKPVHRDLTFVVHEQAAEAGAPGGEAEKVRTGARVGAHEEDRLGIDVIPPDLLRDVRSETKPRPTSPETPSSAGKPKAHAGAKTGASAPRTERRPASRGDKPDRKAGKAIVWTLDGEDSPSPGPDPSAASGRDLHPLDEKPARIVVMPDKPRKGDRDPASRRDESRGHAGAARNPPEPLRQHERARDLATEEMSSDEPVSRQAGQKDEDPGAPAPHPSARQASRPAPRQETPHRDDGRQKGRSRAPLDAVAVGHDAVRNTPREEARPAPKAREHRRTPTQRTPPATGRKRPPPLPASDRARRASAAAGTSARRVAVESDAPAIPDERPGGDALTGRRGYYDKARAVPDAKDDPSAFFRKGALKTQQRVIVMGALSIAAVLIIVLTIVILF